MSRFRLLSEVQWSLIASMLPSRTGRQGRPFSDAARWSRRSSAGFGAGSPGVICPEVFAAWQTVWTWHRHMAADDLTSAKLVRTFAVR